MAREVELKPMEVRPINGDEPNAAPAASPARRKFLKHGVAGGSVAALVAGKPVKTLAKAYCKFSGWNSMKVKKKGKGKSKSKKGGLTLSNAPAPTCSVKVKSPSTFVKTTNQKTKNGKKTYLHNGVRYAAVNWPPKGTYFLETEILTTATFGAMFGSGDYAAWTLLEILATAPTTVAAYMLAVAFASTKSGFPLSQKYVLSLWTTYGNGSEQAALLTFLQQLV
jgi:hypothetical protein